MSKQTMELALEALEELEYSESGVAKRYPTFKQTDRAIDALKEAIKQHDAEPVAGDTLCPPSVPGKFVTEVPNTYARGSKYALLTDGHTYLCPECGGYGSIFHGDVNKLCGFCDGRGTIELTDARIHHGEE